MSVRLIKVPRPEEPQAGREEMDVPIRPGDCVGDLIPARWREDENTRVLLNGEFVPPDRWDARFIKDGDDILLTKAAPGAIGSLIAVSLFGLAAGSVGAFVVSGAINLAFGFGLSYLSSLLVQQPEMPKQRESRIYGGGPMRTVQGSGWTRPRVYGRMKVPGTIIHAGTRHHQSAGPHPTHTPRFFRTLGQFRSVNIYAWCQGPANKVCGVTRDTDSMYLPNSPSIPQNALIFDSDELRAGGNPIKGIVGNGTVSHRMGKLDQDAFPYLVGGVREVPVDVVLKDNKSVTYETTGPMDGFAIVIFFPQGFWRIKQAGSNKGARYPSSITTRIRARVKGQTTWPVWYQFTENFEAYDSTGLTYYWFAGRKEGNPSLRSNRAEIEITNVWYPGGKPPFTRYGEIRLLSVNEFLVEGAAQFPHIVATMLDASVAYISGPIQQMTAVIEGSKVWTFDETGWDTEPVYFEWSERPVDCIIDAYLSEAVMGDTYHLGHMDMPSLMEAKAWHRDLVPNGRGGKRERFVLGYVWDQARGARDHINAMGASCRTKFTWFGSKLKAVMDREEDPQQTLSIFGMGSILPGTFVDTPLTQEKRPNAIELEYLDENEDYTRRIAPWRDDEQIALDGRIRSERISIPSITNRSQALAMAEYLGRIAKYVDRIVEFDVGPDGLATETGKVIGIHHSVEDFGGISGRVHATPGALSIQLDQEIEIEADKKYQVAVHTTGTGSKVIQVRDIILAPGIYAAKYQIPISPTWDVGDHPVKYDNFIAGAEAGEGLGPSRLYRIIETKRREDLSTHVVALRYDKRVYLHDPPHLGLPPTRTTKTRETIPPAVRNIGARVDTVSVAKYTGGGMARVTVTWENPDWPFPFKSAVYVKQPWLGVFQRHRDMNNRPIDAEGESISFDRVIEGYTYEVAICPMASAGAAHNSYLENAQVSIKVPRTTLRPPVIKL